ncbi:hypothetical protein LguiA_010521 [Lonicera macranthoides]
MSCCCDPATIPISAKEKLSKYGMEEEDDLLLLVSFGDKLMRFVPNNDSAF